MVHLGRTSLVLSVLLWLTTTSWSGWEPLSRMTSNLVSIFLSDTTVRLSGPNKSYVVTVTVFSNLYEEKKYHSCTWRSVHPPVCPTNSSSHFCLKNSVCHRQKTLTHRVSSRPRLQTSDFRKQPLSPQVSQTASSLLMVIM